MRKTDNLESYRIFCAVAACGGVKEAGIELSMEPSNIFRLLREQALMLEAIRDNLESDAGLIQIASTAGVRYQTLTPALVQYQNLHPEVTFELRDMVQGARNFFVAPDGSANDIVVTFLSEDPVPEDVHVEKLFDIPFVACASPQYLARFGTPETPADCIHHQGLLLRLPGRHSVEHLAHNGRYEKLIWQSSTIYNSQLDAIEALVLGGGICPDVCLPYFIDEYRKKRLVPVLTGWNRPLRTVCLYTSSHAYKKKRVRQFLTWFGERYKAYLAGCLAEWRRITGTPSSPAVPVRE